MTEARAKLERPKLEHLRPSQLVVDHKWNSRDALTTSAIADAELEADIRKRGLLHPLVVVPIGDEWFLVAGFRRHRACMAIDPERAWPCLSRSFEDFQAELALEVSGANLAENLQRRNLRPFEVADTLHRMREASPGVTLEELAQVTSLSKSYVRNLLRVRSHAGPDLWAVFVRYGKSYPRSIRFDDLVKVAALPKLEQLEAWQSLVEQTKGAPKRRRSRRRPLEDYLAQVDELEASAEFRAGVRFGLRVALKREPWPQKKAAS